MCQLYEYDVCFFKQKTAYEVRISDWSSDVCSSDLTTDLHFIVRSYDYFKLADDPTYGFERTATLIRAARQEFPNTLLVDNGDTIQGTALADYEAQVAPIPCTSQSSMYRAMAELQFDHGTLRNHDFNNRSEERRVGKDGVS